MTFKVFEFRMQGLFRDFELYQLFKLFQTQPVIYESSNFKLIEFDFRDYPTLPRFADNSARNPIIIYKPLLAPDILRAPRLRGSQQTH